MTSAYFGFHPALQSAIAHKAGWRELRPVQELAAQAIAAGDDCLILAPTAGGKTEAALFPLLDRMLRQRPQGLGLLYVCPLKALLNNQLLRFEQWARWVGLDAFLWHGDVGSAARQSFLRQPCEILMTTPESLEVLLTARSALPLWNSLQAVLVDEIHALAGEERGDQLLCLLERLPAGFQRVGLSATVGNPQPLLRWFQGSHQAPSRVVDPGKTPGRKRLSILPWSEELHRHLQVARLTGEGKSLVFVDSRRKAEELSQALEGPCFLHHASLSAEARQQAEQAFQTSSRACIVATSTMELGLDVGDLDRVVQLHSPPSVASFLQRMGRSGRRNGLAEMAFVTDENWSFLQSCAILCLAMEGWVEPIELQRRSLAVYAQQALARVVAENGLAEGALLQPYEFAPWADIRLEEQAAILEHLGRQQLLERADGRWVLGGAAAQKLGGHQFLELYSVFSSPQQFQVITAGGKLLGQLDRWFVFSLQGRQQASFALGGAHWVVLEIDREQALVRVERAEGGDLPQWHGPPQLLTRRLCQRIRQLLVENDPLPFLDDKGQRVLQGLRDYWQPLLQQAPVNLHLRPQGMPRLYTFAGGKINQVLALLTQKLHRQLPSFNNFYLQFPEPFDDLASLMKALQDPAPLGLEALLPELQLGKFQRFLPPTLERRYRAERLLDESGARQMAAVAWSVVETAGPM